MLDGKEKRRILVLAAIILNAALVGCVLVSVISSFKEAESSSFTQNIENVRTLTDSSAAKVELELKHHTNEVQTISDYINNYYGRGMTEEELTAFFMTAYASQDEYTWHLVNNTTVGKGNSVQGFDAHSYSQSRTSDVFYQASAYPELAKIFCCAQEETFGLIQETSEFTDPSLLLAKSFAIATTVRVLQAEGTDEYQYKTLMQLIRSEYISDLIASNNNVDTFDYSGYSNVIVNEKGDYVISTPYFQGTNIADYIALYNTDFTNEESSTLLDSLAHNHDSDAPLFYRNAKGQDCVYTVAPVENSSWHIVSVVPLSSFHNADHFSLNFLRFGLWFLALFLVDVAFVLLINRQLRKKTAEAKESNQAKSRFLSSMSHDIRTPMNAIIGMTVIADRQLEEDTIDKAALQECVKSIKMSGNHLLTLINDVLDISSIESGKTILRPSDFSIADAVGKAIDICRQRIQEKDFTFETHIKGVTHEYVYGDALRVNQIFINILTNAVKYTRSGGKITVDFSEQVIPGQEDKARFVYVVSDTGIGMTPEFVSKIFDRFSRAVDTRINSVEGTGLGMSIVKQLVDLMGGTIQVDSAVDVGSTFTVTLDFPIVREASENKTYSGTFILLIDDDPILLDSTKVILENTGITVDTALSGSQGVQMAVDRRRENNDYQMIFVDWRLGKASGGDVIQSLRKELGNDPCIAVMTAYNIPEIEHDARQAGATVFINKPLFKFNLLSTIDRAMSGERISPKAEVGSYPDLRVLVAEDNDTNWKVFNKILKYYKIQAERAENGQRAFEMIQSNAPYDLVFMDIRMPVLDGYEATLKIRAIEDPTRAKTPIYAMSADAFADDIRKCKGVGMNGHFSKPVDMDEVLKVIRLLYKNKEDFKAEGGASE